MNMTKDTAVHSYNNMVGNSSLLSLLRQIWPCYVSSLILLSSDCYALLQLGKNPHIFHDLKLLQFHRWYHINLHFINRFHIPAYRSVFERYYIHTAYSNISKFLRNDFLCYSKSYLQWIDRIFSKNGKFPRSMYSPQALFASWRYQLVQKFFLQWVSLLLHPQKLD